jgi:hypothetical protein
MTDYEILKYF